MKKVSTEEMLQTAFKKVKPEHMARFVRALTDVVFERAEHLNRADREQFESHIHDKLIEFQISNATSEYVEETDDRDEQLRYLDRGG